jgi:hypothetical protein
MSEENFMMIVRAKHGLKACVGEDLESAAKELAKIVIRVKRKCSQGERCRKGADT